MSWDCTLCGKEGIEPWRSTLLGVTEGEWVSFCADAACDQQAFIVTPTPEEQAWLLLKGGRQ